MTERPRVAVYRDDLLALSERFILDQAHAVTRYEPFLVGTRQVEPFETQLPVELLFGRMRTGVDTTRLEPAKRAIVKLLVAAYRTGAADLGFTRRVRQLRPSLVHAHFAVDGLQALRLSRRLGVPLVTTLHGYDVLHDDVMLAKSHRGRALVAGRRRLQDAGALFIAVSEFLLSRAIAAGYPEARTVRHYIGVDPRFWSPNSPDVGSRTRCAARIVHVARLVPYKGADDVLTVAAGLRGSQGDVHVVIIGEGPERARLEERVRREALRVEFTGRQSREQIREHLAQATIVCNPSHERPDGSMEALGLVNLEAQAMGVPVVAYDSGGVGETVVDGVTGRLAPERDVDKLTRAVSELLAAQDLRRRMGLAARERVARLFNLSVQTSALEDHYDRALASRAAARCDP